MQETLDYISFLFFCPELSAAISPQAKGNSTSIGHRPMKDMTIKQSPVGAQAYAPTGLESTILDYTGRCPVLVLKGFQPYRTVISCVYVNTSIKKDIL